MALRIIPDNPLLFFKLDVASGVLKHRNTMVESQEYDSDLYAQELKEFLDYLWDLKAKHQVSFKQAMRYQLIAKGEL